jgi:hypothetical protein
VGLALRVDYLLHGLHRRSVAEIVYIVGQIRQPSECSLNEIVEFALRWVLGFLACYWIARLLAKRVDYRKEGVFESGNRLLKNLKGVQDFLALSVESLLGELSSSENLRVRGHYYTSLFGLCGNVEILVQSVGYEFCPDFANV